MRGGAEKTAEKSGTQIPVCYGISKGLTAAHPPARRYLHRNYDPWPPDTRYENSNEMKKNFHHLISRSECPGQQL
jgi:hypothetical protein